MLNFSMCGVYPSSTYIPVRYVKFRKNDMNGEINITDTNTKGEKREL